MVNLSDRPRLARAVAVFLGLACGYLLLAPLIQTPFEWAKPLIVLIGKSTGNLPEALSNAVAFGAVIFIQSLPNTLAISALAALFVRRFGYLRHVSYAVVVWAVCVHGVYRLAIWYMRGIADRMGVSPDLAAFDLEYWLPSRSVNLLLTCSVFLVLLYLFGKSRPKAGEARPESSSAVPVSD